MLRWLFSWRDPEWPQMKLEDIRKRARLLAIDDLGFDYQSLFQRDGYNLTVWRDIERLSDIERGDFDLVLLDLQGIGRSESSEEGIGILKHLRAACPALTIVVYSNADWGLQYQQHFSLANGVLAKSADYVAFKGRVDTLLVERFSLSFYLDLVKEAVGDAEVDHAKLRQVASKAIVTQKPALLRGYLATSPLDPSTVDRVISIANAGIGLLQIWTQLR